MAYSDIPAELRAIPSWCCWKYEDVGAKKPTKVPYNSITHVHASSINSSTWSTFDDAVAASKTHDYNGIGFFFSNSDPYSFIDLDDTEGDQSTLDRQIKIYREFASYSEISPGGKGLHIIVRGIVPGGRRRSHIEIYSSERYATMTGNVYNSAPIAERQSMLMSLWEQMGAGTPATLLYKGDDKEQFNDQEILDRAKAAINGEKFNTLLSGKWQDLYQSQSEADFAFIDIIAFYTQNKNQITRIFRNSLLGKRDKANRKDYVTWMISKSFDRMLPPLDFDGFKTALEAKQLELKLGSNAGSSNGRTTPFDGANLGSNPSPVANSTIAIPPGLLGELAQFIYQAAPRPVPEIALAAAIGLMAGITGRAYNISKTGLNLYVLLLARTGRGKEGAASGIDQLMNAIKLQVPTSTRFRGPGIINSGQALIKYLSNSSNCFVSILGEFGMTLERISSPRANSADKLLYQLLFDLYTKSGHGQTFQPSIYSKKEDTVNATESPALSIFGESTHKVFYNALNEDMIAAGLLPRFLIIDYGGDRVDLNENHVNIQPSFQLIEKLASLAANAELVMHNKKVIHIATTDEAALMLRNYDKKTTKDINLAKDDIIAELWNRAHMKVMRLAGIIAVGVNMSDPLILPGYITWAMNLVENDIKIMSSKFEAGEIGAHTHESKQLTEMQRVIKEFVNNPWEKVSKYIKEHHLHTAKVVPYTYINKRLVATAAYRLDRSGATIAIKRSLQTLIDSDIIREIGKQDLATKYGTTQRCFLISNLSLLDG